MSKNEIKKNTIKNNTAGGDIVIGSQYKFEELPRNIDALKNLVKRSKKLCHEDKEYKEMLIELNEYFKPRKGRKIIGLEEKLKKGKREDLIEDGEYLENKFARKVSSNQFSITEEVIYLHCLSFINSTFSAHIKPLIYEKASKSVVDKMILTKIVNPLYDEISNVSVSITHDMIRGMIYFLTGKCHLIWN